VLFGDVTTFAIECDNIRFIQSDAYANFRFIAAGNRIGDFDDRVLLCGCVNWGLNSLNHCGQRYEEAFDGMSKSELYFIIHECLRNIEARCTVEKMGFDPSDLYHRFVLDDVGMSAFEDKVGVVLVETKSGYDRLIWSSYDESLVNEVTIPNGGYERAVRGFLTWMDGEFGVSAGPRQGS